MVLLFFWSLTLSPTPLVAIPLFMFTGVNRQVVVTVIQQLLTRSAYLHTEHQINTPENCALPLLSEHVSLASSVCFSNIKKHQ